MAKKRSIEKWIDQSFTAQKIVEYQVRECTNKIQREPENPVWIYQNVRSTVIRILEDLHTIDRIPDISKQIGEKS